MSGVRLIITCILLSIGFQLPAIAAGDPEKGQRVFNLCKTCHTLEPGAKATVGPNLHGVFGRKAGTADGYKYSDAMIKSGITWDEPNLTKYLTDPKGAVPGNKMAFVGLKKDQDRDDLIAYLRQASGKP